MRGHAQLFALREAGHGVRREGGGEASSQGTWQRRRTHVICMVHMHCIMQCILM